MMQMTELDFNNTMFDYQKKTQGNRLFLNLGDFSIFNLMVVFIWRPIWSMTPKILPLPVMSFSKYIIILNVIMPWNLVYFE